VPGRDSHVRDGRPGHLQREARQAPGADLGLADRRGLQGLAGLPGGLCRTAAADSRILRSGETVMTATGKSDALAGAVRVFGQYIANKKIVIADTSGASRAGLS